MKQKNTYGSFRLPCPRCGREVGLCGGPPWIREAGGEDHNLHCDITVHEVRRAWYKCGIPLARKWAKENYAKYLASTSCGKPEPGKKPLKLMFDGTSHKPVVVIARVLGCQLLVGLENKPLSERRMNRAVKGITAVCKKHGVDHRSLGRELIRLGRKLRGRLGTWRAE